MSEDIEVTETDKELNFKALREKTDALEARLAELSPLAVEKAVRSAGFDPDSPEGKALTRLSTVDSDAEAVKSLAAELGFEASKPAPQLNENEQVAVAQAQRLADINAVTSPDNPPTAEDRIAELYAEGRGEEARALKIQTLVQNAAG